MPVLAGGQGLGVRRILGRAAHPETDRVVPIATPHGKPPAVQRHHRHRGATGREDGEVPDQDPGAVGAGCHQPLELVEILHRFPIDLGDHHTAGNSGPPKAVTPRHQVDTTRGHCVVARLLIGERMEDRSAQLQIGGRRDCV